MPICSVGALAWRCDVRVEYASRRASRAALHLDIFEQPGRKRVFGSLTNKPSTRIHTEDFAVRTDRSGGSVSGLLGTLWYLRFRVFPRQIP
jgi:hypothetical protein